MPSLCLELGWRGRPALVAASLVAVFSGCGGSADPAPWLTALDAASHERFFPIRAGAHGGVDCDDCHGRFDTFTRFSCTDCHAHERTATDAQHPTVDGYLYAETSCFDCHPRGDGVGSLSREAHAAFFPIGMGTAHASSSCGRCHLAPEVLECSGCHRDPEPTRSQHARVGGYRSEAGACLRCHYDASVPRLDNHRFRIDTRSEHPPHETGCLECHPATLPDRPFPSAEFRLFDCARCHSRGDLEEEHADLRGYRYDSRSCVQAGCHPTGEED